MAQLVPADERVAVNIEELREELAMRNRLPLATLNEGFRRAAKKAGVVLPSE